MNHYEAPRCKQAGYSKDYDKPRDILLFSLNIPLFQYSTIPFGFTSP